MWRPLERAIIEILKAEGFDVTPDSASGDEYVSADYINVTELAKELVKRGFTKGAPK